MSVVIAKTAAAPEAIVDVDANGNITVLNGNGEILTQAAPTVPSGIM